jgi:hypothetical protein
MATIDELGLTPYQRIMAQMTPTMNPYTGAGVAIGGYDPALYRRMSGSGLINYGGGGGFGGGGGDSGSVDAVPSAWDNMTNAEKAAYYAENPNMAAITQLGQKAFGFTTPGFLQSMMNPGFVSEQGLIAMGVNPAAYQAAKESFRASEFADMNGGFQSAMDAAQSYGGASMAEQQAMNDAISAAADAAQGAAVGEGQTSISDSASSAADGYGSGDSAGFGGGTDSGSDGWANGGKVTKNRLKGPDPKGPDEGYGALLSGEYVIKKSAVKKYGQGLLDMINDGKIPAKKMKSLLG